MIADLGQDLAAEVGDEPVVDAPSGTRACSAGRRCSGRTPPPSVDVRVVEVSALPRRAAQHARRRVK